MYDEETKEILRRIERHLGVIRQYVDTRLTGVADRVGAQSDKKDTPNGGAEHRKPVLSRPATKTDKKNTSVAALIGCYVKHWQERYQTKARPDTISAPAIFKALLKDRTQEKLEALLQIYCQMEDRWFTEKRHDLATFKFNIGKVDLALHAGHENTGLNMGKVFGGIGDGQKRLSDADRQNDEDVG